jgi:uncharacterized protein (DUF2461 family)
MRPEQLFGNMNRNATSAAGYTHWQISKDTLIALKTLVTDKPEAMVALLNMCINMRGVDGRRKDNK